MVPAAYVVMEAWPLSVNGKLDRNRLPAPDIGAYTQRTYTAPEGEAESILAQVWSQVLGVPRVGRHDNFFELGGDSIRSIAVVAQSREQGITFAIADLFKAPTVAELARGLGGGQGATPKPRPLAPDDLARLPPGLDDAYAATLLQQGMMFHAHRAPDSGAYHDVFSYELELPQWREDFMRDALDAATMRHPALRTAFVHGSYSEPLQLVHAHARIPLEVHDLRHLDSPEQQQTVEEAITRERGTVFDLEQPPLCRVFVHLLEGCRIRYTMSFHHAILDGWSVALLQTELFSHYLRLTAGESVQPTPSPAASPADAVALEQAALSDSRQEAFWRHALDGFHRISLPAHDGDLVAGESYHSETVAIDDAVEHALYKLAQTLGVPVRTLLLTAHLRVLASLGGGADVTTGLVSNVRPEAAGGDQVLGLFLNTLPLRVHLSPCRWRDLVMQVHQAELAAIEHRYYPYFRLHREHGGASLFDAIFNYVNFHVYGALEGTGLRLLGAAVHEWTGYPLDVSFSHTGSRLILQVNVDPARLSPGQARRIVDYLVKTIATLAHTPESEHGSFALPGADELIAFNAWGSTPALASAGPGAPATVHAGIEAQVRLHPDALAIVDGSNNLSYAELDARAEVLASRLRRCGASPGTRVAISLPRGADVIVGMLGILKSGAAYVPIDPVYPDARIADTLLDSCPIAVLTHTASLARLQALCSDQPITVVAIDEMQASAADVSAWGATESLGTEQGEGVTPCDPAYVIYTSGSTGRPKGVVVEHRNAVHLVRNHLHQCRLQPNDRVMQYATYSFDTSVEEIFPTLWAGATLVVRPSRLIAPDADFHRFLREERITVADLPTAFWHRWVQALVRADKSNDEGVEPGLRLIVVGGEKAEPALLQQWRMLPALRSTHWLNTYGPTETTVYATAQEVDCAAPPREEDGSIGRPIPGALVRVVDSYGQLAPLGALGELWIGGDGVARGYFNRPELTATCFLEDAQGLRWYRTGDLVRWRNQGVLEYLGRNDAQVKLRGYRIEPGEIEAAMMECAALREAVVVIRRDGDGEPRLVAYGVPSSDEAFDTRALRTALAERLPEYMVPAIYVTLASLPLTPSGKIDRAGLPAPSTAAVQTAYVSPLPGREAIIAEVWASLLGLPRIGRHDHFFELGGHSLMIIAMIERLSERGIALDVQAVFDAPQLSQLATHAKASDALNDEANATPPNLLDEGAQRIVPSLLSLVDMDQSDIDTLVAAVPGGAENIQDIYPLGTLQTGILFHHLIHQEGDPYLLRYVVRLADRDRLDRLVEHLQYVIDRHDALRTCVHWEALLQPVQVVQCRARLPVVELSLNDSEDAVTQMFSLTDPRALRKDLRAAPLLEAHYARDHAGGWLLAILVHHMVSDHVTQNLILEEVDLLLRGRGDLLRPSVPYRKFIAAQRFASPAAQRRYFEERFADLERPTIAFGMPEVRGTGQSVVAVHEPMPPSLAADVRLAAQRLGVAPAVLFHVGWARCLSHLVGSDDVVFGTVLSGRLQGVQGAGRAMGVFINTLPVRMRLSGLSLRATVKLAFRELSAILRHEQASLALAQRCSRMQTREPLFNTLFNYRHSPIASSDVAARARETWQGIDLILGEERTNYPLAVSVDDQGAGHGFVVSVQCVAGIDPAAVCAMTMGAMSRIVAALEESPEQPLAQIDVELEVEA
ncbi:Gramicidin S synthase 2 [Dyella sp. AD56]|nr:Gramicidin S synthase 2 [Dyella sp. AD56]